MTILHWYYLLTAVVASSAMILTPSKMSPLSNFMASVLLGVTVGWLLWPVFIVGLIKAHR